MRLYLFFLILLAPSLACKYTKMQVKTCVEGFDKGGDGVGKDDIAAVVDQKLYWYEKLVYPTEKIINQIEKDCGFPMDFGKKTCFQSCFYRESVYSRLCT